MCYDESFKHIRHVGPKLLSGVMHCRNPFGEVLFERLRTETAFVAQILCASRAVVVVKNTRLLTWQI